MVKIQIEIDEKQRDQLKKLAEKHGVSQDSLVRGVIDSLLAENDNEPLGSDDWRERFREASENMEGDWEGLAALQDSLKGGRRV